MVYDGHGGNDVVDYLTTALPEVPRSANIDLRQRFQILQPLQARGVLRGSLQKSGRPAQVRRGAGNRSHLLLYAHPQGAERQAALRR